MIGINSKHELKTTNEQIMNKVENDKIDIIKQYVSGTSSEIIAKQYEVNGSTICRLLKRNNIQIRPNNENKVHIKKNRDYFSEINTNDKAYFLGLLYADGSVREGGYSFKIVVHKKDIDVVEKLRDKIFLEKLNDRIKGGIEEGDKYIRLSVSDVKMVSDLVRHGCTPNKTFTIRFPNVISKEFYPDFIRGVMDGDGCIYIAKNNKTIKVDFTSNYEFVKDLKTIIESCGFRCGKPIQRKKNKLTGAIQITGRENVIKFLDWLYAGDGPHMNRKYEKYQQIKAIEEAKSV